MSEEQIREDDPAAEDAAREIAEDRARAMARRHGEALGSWGIRMYGERSREERAEADRVWAAMSDEDRERVWKHGAAIVVSGADGSMCRNLGRLADEWAKASGITEAHTETDPARAARRIAELERALASASDTIDLTASEMGRMREALHAVNAEVYTLTQRLAVEARQRDEAIARYDALGEAVEKHLPDSSIPGVTAVDRVIAAGAVLEHYRRTLAAIRPVLDDMARSFSASTSGEPHDVAIRVAYRVAELQKEHAKVSRSRDRWRARAKRAAVQTRGQRLHAEFLKPPAGVSRTTTRGKRTRSKR